MARSVVDLSAALMRDPDATVRDIGRRCLRDYDEFAGLKYCRLTRADATHLEATMAVARGQADRRRLALLEGALAMVSVSLAEPQPAPRASPRASARR